MIRTREQDANLPFPDATYVSYPFVFGQLPFGTWIASAALLIALILTAVVGTPTDARPFAVWDPALNYEQQEDAVGGVWCVVVGAITLIVTVVFIECYVMHLALVNRTNKLMRSIHFLAYALFGSLLTSLAQQITALMVGVHRPDFISRCRPQPSLEYDPTFPVQYFHRSICLSDRDHDFHEGLKSYPSGHASSSMFLAIYMSGYLLYSVFWRPKLLAPGKAWRSVEVRPAGLELNSPWWHPSQSPRQRLLRETAHLGVLLWVFLNLGWAWGVASSRISDNRHSIEDILGGMLLGTVCSVVFLLQALGIECRLPMYGVPHFNFHDATHRVGTSDAGQAHTVSAGTSLHVPMEAPGDESVVADNSIALQPPSQLAEMAARS